MRNNKNLRKWLDDMQLSHPLLIAGPCSAETEQQVLDIANQLKDSNASVFRAGIWKPRTRPGYFEGVGSLALQWMKKVKLETGMLTTTEVANPNHVEKCMLTMLIYFEYLASEARTQSAVTLLLAP